MMMEPKIRFKGFSGEWNTQQIGDIATFSKGKGYSKADLCSEGNPIILYGSMYTNYSSVIDNVITFAPIYDGVTFSKGNEVIIPASGETPEDIAIASAVKQKDVILGGDINIVNFDKEFEPAFMALTISNGKTHYELSRYAQGKTIVHLHNTEIAKGTISAPSLPEQRALATFFTSLDNQISAAEKRLASLKQVKAASLQAMFPQEGETTPKLRFKGCEGEWEKVKLGECGTFSKGKGYSKAGIRAEGTPIILYGSMYTNYSTIIDKVDTYAKMNDGAVLSKGGEIIIPASGETPEDIAIASVVKRNGILLGGDLNIITLGDGYDSTFIALGITYSRTHIELSKYAQGKSVVHLHNSEIAQGSIMCPNSLPEQHQIASYFTALDRQITAQSSKISKLKQIKSACLDQMFV